MAKRPKTTKLSREDARQTEKEIKASLRKLERELRSLQGRVEGSSVFAEIQLASSTLAIKKAVKNFCTDPHTMSAF